MPLVHGTTPKTIKANISKNIATEKAAGVPHKQAIAIALSVAREDAKKAGIKPPRVAAQKA